MIKEFIIDKKVDYTFSTQLYSEVEKLKEQMNMDVLIRIRYSSNNKVIAIYSKNVGELIILLAINSLGFRVLDCRDITIETTKDYRIVKIVGLTPLIPEKKLDIFRLDSILNYICDDAKSLALEINSPKIGKVFCKFGKIKNKGGWLVNYYVVYDLNKFSSEDRQKICYILILGSYLGIGKMRERGFGFYKVRLTP